MTGYLCALVVSVIAAKVATFPIADARLNSGLESITLCRR